MCIVCCAAGVNECWPSTAYAALTPALIGPAPTEPPCGNCAAIVAATAAGLGPTEGSGREWFSATLNCVGFICCCSGVW